jgi:hypothetical protein
MTLRAILLWALAAVVAGALAYWDYVQSSAIAPRAPEATIPDDVGDVEVEVIYEDGP